MAAPILTTATTLEGQAFEIFQALQAAEFAQPEAARPNRATIAVDFEARSISLTATFDAGMTTAETGIQQIVAVPYLP